MSAIGKVATGDLSAYLAENPGAIVEQVAAERGLTPRAVVEALPREMRRFISGAHFMDVMTAIGGWGDVTFIVHTADGIFEFSGSVPAGSVSRGYYNIPGGKGLHGHLRHERCTEIGFLERPFMGRLSAAVLFFNAEGGIMFKVFVGRDENRELKADQLSSFRALPGQFTAH